MREFLRVQVFVFCCYLGGFAGSGLSVGTLGRWAAERYEAEHPGEYRCGMFAIPYLFLGFVPGAVVGAIAGWRAQRWLVCPHGQESPQVPAKRSE
jgi:hypothetical protein